MPTLRERTSASSAAILGMSMSRTAACRGSSKTSAFIGVSFSLTDQNFDLVCASGCEPGERFGRFVEADRARDDLLDRESTGRDLRGNPVEAVDPVAPR